MGELNSADPTATAVGSDMRLSSLVAQKLSSFNCSTWNNFGCQNRFGRRVKETVPCPLFPVLPCYAAQGGDECGWTFVGDHGLGGRNSLVETLRVGDDDERAARAMLADLLRQMLHDLVR